MQQWRACGRPWTLWSAVQGWTGRVNARVWCGVHLSYTHLVEGLQQPPTGKGSGMPLG